MIGLCMDITHSKQIEEELRLNRNMLKKILDTVPQSIFWKDRNSNYLGCNEVFAREMGLDDAKQIIGKSDYDITHLKEDADAYRTDDKDVIERNESKQHIIEQMQKSDGKRIWVDTTKVPLNDEQGNVMGILGIYEDITDRKKAEETLEKNERRLSLAISATSDAIWEWNLLTGLAYYSPRWYEMLGYAVNQI